MRGLAALAAAALLFAGAAFAQTMGTFTDPANTFSFQRPTNWPVDRMGDSSDAVGHYAAGLAAAECNFYTIARETTAERSAAAVVAAFSQPMTREQWFQVTSSIRTFRGGADVQTQSVDTSGFWPVQRATILTEGDLVQAAIHARPGREVWVFCQSFDNTDRTQIFNNIIASVNTPRDAELEATAAAAEAAPAPEAASE